MYVSHLHYQPDPAPNVSTVPPLHPERVLGHRHAVAAPGTDKVRELNVSGVRVLLALGFLIGLTGLFLWGVIRDWLFAP